MKLCNELKELLNNTVYRSLTPLCKSKLFTTLTAIKRPISWALLAFELTPNGKWNEYGFGLFTRPDYIAKIDQVYNKLHIYSISGDRVDLLKELGYDVEKQIDDFIEYLIAKGIDGLHSNEIYSDELGEWVEL